jgi:hypothetical protein
MEIALPGLSFAIAEVHSQPLCLLPRHQTSVGHSVGKMFMTFPGIPGMKEILYQKERSRHNR